MNRNENVEWRAIPGYEGRYDCSEEGNVYSLLTNCVLKPYTYAYPSVVLHKDGKRKTHHIHALVASAFLGERPIGLVVNHIDSVKTNNHVSNLEYITHKMNVEHAIKIGIRNDVGEENSYSKLCNEDIPKIRELLASREFTQMQIAKMFGISNYSISLIKTGKTWQSVDGGLELDLGDKPHVLKEEEVKEIRQILDCGDYSYREIGKMFGVSEKAIWRIATGRTWKNIK